MGAKQNLIGEVRVPLTLAPTAKLPLDMSTTTVILLLLTLLPLRGQGFSLDDTF